MVWNWLLTTTNSFPTAANITFCYISAAYLCPVFSITLRKSLEEFPQLQSKEVVQINVDFLNINTIPHCVFL